MEHPQVLVVDGDAARRGRLLDGLPSVGMAGRAASTWEDARRVLRSSSTIRVVLIDPSTAGVPGIDEAVREARSGAADRVVVVVGVDPLDPRAESAGDAGAFDVVEPEADSGRLLRAARAAARHAEVLAELARVRERTAGAARAVAPVGSSAAIERLRDRIDRFARDEAPVLFVGESGTGRTHAARATHAASRRADGPFVVVHVTAFPDDRLESELFGMRDETGERRIGGAIAAARGGTLFLEEVAGVSPRLLERLREAIVASDADVRWIASTATDLHRAAETGRFDAALLRLFADRVVTVVPLRDRLEDVPLLVRHFLSTISEVNRLDPILPTPEVLAVLRRYSWPGNVRELRNAIEQAAIVASGDRIGVRDLPDRVVTVRGEVETSMAYSPDATFRDAKQAVVANFEREYLSELMTRSGGNVTAAAQESGMLRSALQRLLRKHGLRSIDFRRRKGKRPPQEADAGGPAPD